MRPMVPPPVPLPMAEVSIEETVTSPAAVIATEPPLAPNTPPGPELPRVLMATPLAVTLPPDSTIKPPELVALPALEVVIGPLKETEPTELNTATVPP